jgi:hypothetical protein
VEVAVGADVVVELELVRSPVPVYVTLTAFSVQAINARGRYEPPLTSNDKVAWPVLGASILVSISTCTLPTDDGR